MSLERKKLIYHIYWGTAGNAGLYLDEIYQSLRKAGYEQKVFVNYYYPFNYGEKVFFKRTEMEHCHYKGAFRKIMQIVEFLYALATILIQAKKDKPGIVNYSYVSRGNILILYFLKRIIKISGCRLVITCHDVVPALKDKSGFEKELRIKRKIYSLADNYLIHNENSRKDLINLFKISESQIVQHIFPLMDLSKLDGNHNPATIKYDYLFIGHMRHEKGVSILYEAWLKFHSKYPETRLCLAGNPYDYACYLNERKESCKKNSIHLLLKFISDSEYVDLVKSSRCVVFPYTAGTNSGVISTVASLRKDVITSDLAMFVTSHFVPKNSMFKTGDSEDLAQKLSEYQEGMLASDMEERVANYRIIFDAQVKDVYESLIKS